MVGQGPTDAALLAHTIREYDDDRATEWISKWVNDAEADLPNEYEVACALRLHTRPDQLSIRLGITCWPLWERLAIRAARDQDWSFDVCNWVVTVLRLWAPDTVDSGEDDFNQWISVYHDKYQTSNVYSYFIFLCRFMPPDRLRPFFDLLPAFGKDYTINAVCNAMMLYRNETLENNVIKWIEWLPSDHDGMYAGSHVWASTLAVGIAAIKNTMPDSAVAATIPNRLLMGAISTALRGSCDRDHVANAEALLDYLAGRKLHLVSTWPIIEQIITKIRTVTRAVRYGSLMHPLLVRVVHEFWKPDSVVNPTNELRLEMSKVRAIPYEHPRRMLVMMMHERGLYVEYLREQTPRVAANLSVSSLPISEHQAVVDFFRTVTNFPTVLTAEIIEYTREASDRVTNSILVKIVGRLHTSAKRPHEEQNAEAASRSTRPRREKQKHEEERKQDEMED
jgi:hypothetical protein